jgi:membrane protein DedA with SNARE-associated domain
MLDSILEFMDNFGYIAIFSLMIIENLFPPIPSEIILPLAGVSAGLGDLNLFLVILIATIGNYIGVLPFYILGYKGEKLVYSFVNKYGKYFLVDIEDLEKSKKAFQKHGNIIIMAGRILPAIRTLISVPAGMFKVDFKTYTVYTIIGSIFWNSTLVLAGYFLGQNWEVVESIVENLKAVVILAVILASAGFIIYKLKKKKSSKKDA